MFNLPVYVGIDYHQKTIQVCVMDQQRKILANQSVENDPKAVFRIIVVPFGSNIHVAIESCTGAADFAEKLIVQYQWSVALAHPGYVARMKQTPDKSDWTDAKLLADLTRAGYIPRVWLAPQNIRDLRALVRHRHALVQQRVQIKLRIRALIRNHRIVCPYRPWTINGKKWLLEENNIPANLQFLLRDDYDLIDFINKKIANAEKRMEAEVVDDPVVKKLLLQPGVGPITAITMRAMIGQFDRFRTGKQLAHFCAVCPRNNSSAGKATTGGLIKAGDELLRQVLVEAVHRLMRYNPEWKAMAEHLRGRGKKTCVIVAAVANRWIRKLFRQMVADESNGKTEMSFLRHGQESTIAV
jgi:transposase